MSTLETYGGAYFDFVAPDPEQVKLDDIAQALANTCRFGGHVKRFYSVAEHAVLVAHLVREDARWLGLPALHHDSHEAYLGDIPTPLKADLGENYRVLVARADKAISAALGGGLMLDMHHPIVKAADALALRLEARELKVSRGVGEHWGHDTPPRSPVPWRLGLAPDVARDLFLHYHVICGGRR